MNVAQFEESYSAPLDLGGGVYCVDLFEGGEAERTCAYIVGDSKCAAIVETGSAPLTWRVLRALEDLKIPKSSVEWVILTHIHLDHGGGAGWIMQRLPNAKAAAHSRGAPHLIDPSRLIAGAKAVYGERFDAMFTPIIPIPEAKVVAAPDGGTLELSSGRKFEIIYMAGHARHHFVVVDRTSDGVFTGDNAGVRFPWFRKYGLVPAMASTSPSEFDPSELDRTMERLLGLGVSRFYYTHFSVGDAVNVSESRNWAKQFKKFGEESGPGWETIRDTMRKSVITDLGRRGVPASAAELRVLELDLELNAKGVAVWLERQAKAQSKG